MRQHNVNSADLLIITMLGDIISKILPSINLWYYWFYTITLNMKKHIYRKFMYTRWLSKSIAKIHNTDSPNNIINCSNTYLFKNFSQDAVQQISHVYIKHWNFPITQTAGFKCKEMMEEFSSHSVQGFY